ncbi:hypothetical protein EXW62_27640 (plasmid) [Bacillus mycoides]|nr:hypothetical protein EXW62_27640 [Bacillus mycoides]
MYKKMNRVIEKEKGEFLVIVGICLFLATDNVALCELGFPPKYFAGGGFLYVCSYFCNLFILSFDYISKGRKK